MAAKPSTFVEFRDLRWAVVASQNRSLRQAAEILNVRQSTLSRRLRDLEAHLGVQLFERTNGGTHPSVAGHEFLSAARRILAETESAIRKLKMRSRGENGRLTIGIYASLSTGNMYATLVEHHLRFPEVEIHTVDGDHDQLVCSLNNDAVDIAVMTASRSGWDDLALPLWSERVIIALNHRHPLSEKEVVYWPDLAGDAILIPQHGPGPELERLLVAKLRDYGPQRIIYQESALDRLLSLVNAEYGVLLMLEGATGVHYDGVTYREVHDGDGPTRLNFSAYWRKTNSNPTLQPFVTMLRQRYPDLSGNGATP